MTRFGAVAGPVALAWGLQRTSGSSASLMLTLEAVFTALLAWRLYGEAMDRRVRLALLISISISISISKGPAEPAETSAQNGSPT